ncbi:MAG: DUF2207 domain-containing protein [Christensenellales bacterium]
MKRLVLAAAVLLTLCVPKTAYADEAYDILNHDVHITVGENNVIDVVERLTLNFTQERHGFYYELQTKGNLYRDTGSSKYNYHVYDFNVYKNKFELSREGDFLVAKIGDPNILVFGEVTYLISYKCNLGADGIEEFDEFYWNILYCNYNNTIDRASFSIEMPKKFDSKPYIFLSAFGSADESGVYWQKDGNTITGQTLRTVRGGEYITARITLPQGYFVGATDPAAAWRNAILIVSGLCVLLAFLLWVRYGRDEKVFPTVEFYPPDKMTPAEAGYIIDGCVDDKDVVSLLLYWADKGYIKIVERSKGDFELVKLKDLDDVKSFERPMFRKLFAMGDAVAVSSLKYSFYTTMSTTKTAVKNYFEGAKSRQIYTKESKRARIAMGLITMLPIALTLFWVFYAETYDFMLAAAIAVAGGWIISLPLFILVRVIEKWKSTKKVSRIAQLAGSIFVLAAALAVYIALMNKTTGFDLLAATCGATIVLLLLTMVMHKHTKQGAEWLAKLIGFKEFIEKAEKDRIKVLVEQNPSYFYNVLPYAYVLGVTDKWAKNFKNIGIQPPDWYSGSYGVSMFNSMVFTSMISRSMTSFRETMVSRPSSSGGGGSFGGGSFGGGGFSGGGGGGGGAGGSW